jgi:hypothetical protein
MPGDERHEVRADHDAHADKRAGTFPEQDAWGCVNSVGRSGRGCLQARPSLRVSHLPRSDGTYYVKSNSITSLGFSNQASSGYKDVTVYTKASIYKVNPGGGITSVDGNVSLRLDAHEGCLTSPSCSGSSGDTIGLTVLSSKNSSLYYSNNWVYDTIVQAWKTVQQSLSPGNTAVVIN